MMKCTLRIKVKNNLKAGYDSAKFEENEQHLANDFLSHSYEHATIEAS